MIKSPKGILYDIHESTCDIDEHINLPIFKYIYQNPSSSSVPDNLMNNYTGEQNFVGQTPLMYAVKLGNINYIRQLLRYDICKLDDAYKSALDYAHEFDASNDIITLLEEYELNEYDE